MEWDDVFERVSLHRLRLLPCNTTLQQRLWIPMFFSSWSIDEGGGYGNEESPNENCKRIDYFAITTDIWSLRVLESFMAETLHYLTENFKMVNMVLE